jgi:hypothetical protein
MFTNKTILSVAISLGCILPYAALANMQAFPIDRTSPMPTPTYGGPDTNQVSNIAINAGNTDCGVLENLTSSQKKTVMLTAIFLQTEGILQKIIGPDCHFVGEVQEIAIVNDTNLTIDEEDEILYYSPETNLLFVSYSAKKTIGYGLPYDGTGDPITYFLDRRTQLQTLTENAQMFDEQKTAELISKAQAKNSSRSSEPASSKKSDARSSEERRRIPLEERELYFAKSSSPPVTTTNTAPVPSFLSSRSSEQPTAVEADSKVDEGESLQDPKPIPVIPEDPQSESVVVGKTKGSLWPWIAFGGLIVLVVIGVVLYKKKQTEY